MSDPDAIVVGAGPNGLVAANVLADHGWDVLVLEAQPVPGGAVKTQEMTRPGFHHDVFSSFYPLGFVSPPLGALELERWGLRWVRAPLPLAHAFPDGRAAALSTDLDETAASVEGFAAGDGDAWRALHAWWRTFSGPMVDALLHPFPPLRDTARLLGRLRRPDAVLELARTAVLPVRSLVEERFRGDGAAMLLAGNTLHTDLSPESALGGLFALLLCMLGQDVGFPVPEGGAGRLTDALVARLADRGGRVVCSMPVTGIRLDGSRAVAVRTPSGEIGATRAILADVDAGKLYLDLVGAEHLPARLRRDLHRRQYDHPTVKIDWALAGPVPWIAPAARNAGTVHLGDDVDHLTRFSADLVTGTVPAQPFALFGQMAVADPTRAPDGCEVAWAYTHVPHEIRTDAGGAGITSAWAPGAGEAMADRIQALVEQRAPGFGDLVLDRHVLTPVDLEARDANLVNGSVNGGTAQIQQQLVFRPTPGRSGPATAFRNLYLASASAHPGGAVHGACGANAAVSALRRHRVRRLLALGADR